MKVVQKVLSSMLESVEHEYVKQVLGDSGFNVTKIHQIGTRDKNHHCVEISNLESKADHKKVNSILVKHGMDDVYKAIGPNE